MTRIPDREPDLVVTVLGEPKGKGSTKSFIPKRGDGSMVTRPNGAPMVVTTDDSGKPGKAWASMVAGSVAEAMQDAGMAPVPKAVPVVLEMIFYRPRPAAHFGTGRNADVLKPSAPMAPSTKPDVDKLVRAILDALKSVAWYDDGQVTGAPAWKVFGMPARCELRLWRLPATIADATADALVGTELCDEGAQDALFAA